MYFTSGKGRAFEALMQSKPGFDRFENGGCTEHEKHDFESKLNYC